MSAKISTRRLALLGAYAAAAVTLSAFEGMLPALPFMPPGTKIGLSNVVVMFLSLTYGLPSALGIAGFKSIFTLITRGTAAALMSVAGGVLSCVAVRLVGRCRYFGYMGIGIIGASAHNAAQLAVALLIVGEGMRFYAPVMMLIGVASGSLTAFLLKLSETFMRKLLKEG